jgi:hypothetical protein
MKNEETKKSINAVMEKYHPILSYEMEDYAPDDGKMIYRFWLGFLLGYIRNKPLENILQVIIEEYNEGKNYLPKDIVLEELWPCRIHNEIMYGMKFHLPCGKNFLSRYFKNNDVIICLKSDGSTRRAFKTENDEYLILYVNGDKMNQLKAYLNNAEFDRPNKLRDALIRFYAYYHSHMPMCYSTAKSESDLNSSVFAEMEDLVNRYKKNASGIIYFLAKDIVDDVHAAAFIQKQFNIQNINAETIKKYLSYLFSLKFGAIRNKINQLLEKNVPEDVKLPLILHAGKGTYAYGVYPGFSVSSSMNTGKAIFLKPKNNFKKCFENKKRKIVQKHESNNESTVQYIGFSDIQNYGFKSKKFYIDIPVKLGQNLHNYMQSHVLSQIMNSDLQDNIDEDETKIFEAGFGVFITRLISDVLRFEFDSLLSGLTLGDVLNKQEHAFSIPYAVEYTHPLKKNVLQTGIFKITFPVKADDALLNIPLSSLFNPEDLKLFVDLEYIVEQEDENIFPQSISMFLNLKIMDKSCMFTFLDDEDDFDDDDEDDDEL